MAETGDEYRARNQARLRVEVDAEYPMMALLDKVLGKTEYGRALDEIAHHRAGPTAFTDAELRGLRPPTTPITAEAFLAHFPKEPDANSDTH